jgi:hypothetical protein
MSSLACLDINDLSLHAAETTGHGEAIRPLEDGRPDTPALAGWGGAGWVFGAEAERLACASPHLVCDRHWRQVSRDAVDVPAPLRTSHAQLASQQLGLCLARFGRAPDCIGLVVPGGWQPAHEALVARICSGLSMNVSAWLPAPVVRAVLGHACQPRRGTEATLVVDLGRNGASVTEVVLGVDGYGALESVSPRLGWSDYVRRATREAALECVRSRRIDPMGEAASARVFREALLSALDQDRGGDVLTVAFSCQSQAQCVNVPRPRLWIAAESVASELTRAAVALAAGRSVHIWLGGKADALPGLREALCAGGATVAAPMETRGLAIAGLRVLAHHGWTEGRKDLLHPTHIHPAAAETPAAIRNRSTPPGNAGPAPTHLVHDARLLVLPPPGEDAVIGRVPGSTVLGVAPDSHQPPGFVPLCRLASSGMDWHLEEGQGPDILLNGEASVGDMRVVAGDRIRLSGCAGEILLVRAGS